MNDVLGTVAQESIRISQSRRAIERHNRSHSTDVGLVVSAVGGVCLGFAFYAGVYFQIPDTRFGQIFLDRGWVTKAEAFLAAWAICFMAVKAWQIRRQRRLTKACLETWHGRPMPTVAEARAANLELEGMDERQAGGILYRRIEQSLEHYQSHPSRLAVSELLNSIASVDANRTDGSFTMLRVMIWAIPIIGFIGTVVGLGGAVGGFSESLPKATDFVQLKGLLSGVTSGLSVAFDATFVALLISLLLMFPASALEKSEQDLLAGIDEYCQHDLVGFFAEATTAQPFIDPIGWKKLFEELIESNHQKFLQWWSEAGVAAKDKTEKALDHILTSAAAVSRAAEQLRNAITDAVRESKDMSTPRKIFEMLEQSLQTAISNAAAQLQSAVTAAVSQAGSMSAPLAIASQHASGIAECLNVARGEAEIISTSIKTASVSILEAQSALHNSKGSADELRAASSAIEQHLIAASSAAAQLKANVEAALRSAQDHYTGEVRSHATQIKSQVAVVTQAADGLKAVVERLTSIQVGSDGNGAKV